jgi:hypothetical protein
MQIQLSLAITSAIVDRTLTLTQSSYFMLTHQSIVIGVLSSNSDIPNFRRQPLKASPIFALRERRRPSLSPRCFPLNGSLQNLAFSTVPLDQLREINATPKR